jgi:hypothetical protein
MKPYDKVSSLWGANTLFRGEQNKNRTQKTDTEEGSQKADQQADKSKSKEGPTQITADGITGDPRIRA